MFTVFCCKVCVIQVFLRKNMHTDLSDWCNAYSVVFEEYWAPLILDKQEEVEEDDEERNNDEDDDSQPTVKSLAEIHA
jgi:hypothetical protein